MSTAIKKRPSYTTEQRVKALTFVAGCHGNTAEAARLLAEDGLKVDQKTLWNWRAAEPEQYSRIRQELLPQVEARAIEDYETIAAVQREAALLFTQRAIENIDAIPARDLPSGSKNLTIAAATSTDKSLLLDGKPTQIVHKDVSEVLRKLSSRGIAIDAQVVSEETVASEDGLKQG